MKKKIPNWNSISTLLDRLAIEVVKKCQFADRYEENKTVVNKQKVSTQEEIIQSLKEETEQYLADIWINGEYNCIGEERTFEQ